MISICRSYDLLYYTQFIDYAHELIFFKTTKMCYANNAFTEKYEPCKNNQCFVLYSSKDNGKPKVSYVVLCTNKNAYISILK